MPVEFNHFPLIADRLESGARPVVQTTIKRIEASAKKSLGGPRTGIVYRVGGTKDRPILHQASAPGEPPATETGNLANSITSQMLDSRTGMVSVGAEYAAPLEFGSARGLAPRPFLTPAVERNWPDFLAAMERLLTP
jgi:hypothetical protein